ncbi:MAG: patatin-like phospholipase family protein [Oscillospiraceae bacterium]|nr:patatin-like phospholipase family protein [Oscillospiraceae bacterium]
MKTALVLSGGGSRGAYEIGVWQALSELDVDLSIVTGTSVGALNAAVIAQGNLEQARQLWQELETSHIFDMTLDETLSTRKKWLAALRLFSRAAATKGGVGTKALEKLLHSFLDEETIRRSPVDFGFVTVRMHGMKPCQFWKSEIPHGCLVDHLIASCALFPAIRPQTIDGKKYIDGGFYDNMPIRMAIDRGAEHMIAVDMDAIGMVRWEKEFDHYDIRTIRCYWNLGSILLFDPNSARHNMRLGYLDTMRSFGVYDGFAFAFIKGTVSAMIRTYYANFYETAARFGMENSGQTFLDSVALRAIQKRCQRRGLKTFGIRSFALDGLECAGEVFGLDPTILYTVEHWRERLAETLSNISVPDQPDFSAKTLELLDRRVRTVFLAKKMKEAIEQQKYINLLPIAAVLTDAFSAALYLVLCGFL